LKFLRTDTDPDANYQIRERIISHIAQAVAPERGAAFPRGVSLLQEIYETIDHPRTQMVALMYHAQIAPTGQALVLLRDALATPDARGVAAARILWEDMGQPGIPKLRDAWCGDSIQSPGERRLLQGYAWIGSLDCPSEGLLDSMRGQTP